ncbi:MAG: hypothetical protein ABSD74_03125 [Rhizomicrobium sp.]|jgi:hypothetical protein
MAILMRRAVLVVLTVIVPFLLTYLLYAGSQYLLTATSRTIDPQILWYASGAELLAFLFVAVLEAKSRW